MKKNSFSRLFLYFFPVLIVSIFIFKVRASDTAEVSATVTVQNISITVTQGGTVNYGVLGNNSSKSTVDLSMDTPTAQNNGNVIVDFKIRGTHSNDWTLSDTATAEDVYMHKFCKAWDVADCNSPPTNYIALQEAGYTELAPDVSHSESTARTFHLEITTPNPSTVYTTQDVDVIVAAVLPE